MSYLLTNQNNFGHIPYPSPSHPNATVKSGGCGPCAALMIVENLTPSRYLMKDWIAWVISTGARISGGTAMGTLAAAMAKKFGFGVKTTNSETVLINHLKAGGMAIANVGGAYSDWKGLFSTSGHFVAVLGIGKDGKIIVGDPDFRDGKFTSGTLGRWRSNYASVKDGLVYVKPDFLHLDTKNRTPNYYLFTATAPVTVQGDESEEEKNMVRYKTIHDIPSWGLEAVERLMDRGLLRGTDGGGTINLSDDMLRVLVINFRAGLYDRK